MGDVVLLVPVLRSLVAAHPDVEVTLATRPKFAAFFSAIERVNVFSADVDNRYAGIPGMWKLKQDLEAKTNFDVVVDMHDHIRTIMLRSLFKLAGKKIVVFKKGRAEKRAFTRKENKIIIPLKHSVERYKWALQEAGFEFTLISGPYLASNNQARTTLHQWLEKKSLIKHEKWIGIAPFAMHASKIWPLSNYPGLITSLIQHYKAKIFLFGGGQSEITYFQKLHAQFPDHCIIVAGQLKMPEEIALMQHLDLLVCTDSSNMHLAALSGTPLLSIWGGTHPAVGFAPYGKGDDSILQISREELPCRPCSVFGAKTCHRGDFACLTRIETTIVLTRIDQLLNKI